MATTLTLAEAARLHPGLTTVATRDIPSPDFADVTVVDLPPGAPTDPQVWAREIFAGRGMPGWVRGLMGLRQALVGLIGVRRADRSVFDIDEVHDDEVLIRADDRHLDFRVGVGVDVEHGLVRCATVVRLHGWRGRVYFVPVRVLHAPVVRSMVDGAARRLTPSDH